MRLLIFIFANVEFLAARLLFLCSFLIDAVAMRLILQSFMQTTVHGWRACRDCLCIAKHTVGLPAFTGFGFRLLMGIGGFRHGSGCRLC